jgi:hypothetical protein
MLGYLTALVIGGILIFPISRMWQKMEDSAIKEANEREEKEAKAPRAAGARG